MPLSQANVTADTPMGATLVQGGATFKVWAPGATAVYLKGTFGDVTDWSDAPNSLELTRDVAGYWAGFLPGVADGDEYAFVVVGPSGGTSGFKRDPYARELTASESFPSGVHCIVRSPTAYPWHDAQFATPDYADMVIYQIHVGTYASTPPDYGTFLDVIEKIPVSRGARRQRPSTAARHRVRGEPEPGVQRRRLLLSGLRLHRLRSGSPRRATWRRSTACLRRRERRR